MNSSFKFDDKKVVITAKKKIITIKKTKKAGSFRFFGKKHDKFASGESLYSIQINNESPKENLTLNQMIEVFENSVDSKTLCSLLERLKRDYPENNKPHHFTGMKEKREDVCWRSRKKEAVVKFKLNNEKYLLIRQRNSDPRTRFSFDSYTFYKYSPEKTNTSINLTRLLGIRGEWIKFFEINKETNSLISKFKEGRTINENELSLIQDYLSSKFENGLSENQIDKFLTYLINLSKVQPISLDNARLLSQNEVKETVNNNNSYENIGNYKETPKPQEIDESKKQAVVKFKISDDKYLVFLETDDIIYQGTGRVKNSFVFYKYSPEKTNESINLYKLFGITGNWIKYFKIYDEYDQLIRQHKNGTNLNKETKDLLKIVLDSKFGSDLSEEQIMKIIGYLSELTEAKEIIYTSNITKYKNNKNMGNNSKNFRIL